jgi:hypothetical protein
MKYLVIKDNYVINTIIWDGVTPYTYPEPHDQLLPDVAETVGIGDYYDSTDNTFWRKAGDLNPTISDNIEE